MGLAIGLIGCFLRRSRDEAERASVAGHRRHHRGLWIGTAIGAQLATFLSERVLRLMMPVCIFAMGAFMVWRAAHP